MPSTETAKGDRASEVVPPIRHKAPWRLVSVEVLSERRLRVRFVDGTAGEVLLGMFLESPTIVSTPFEALRESAVFAAARVVMGAVQWPNGADLAPDAMYDAIRQHGRWVLDAP